MGAPNTGALQIDAGGDYVLQQGTALVRKLVIRRLITRPGDFYHLPDYGLGLRIKEPVPGEIITLRGEIERQVELEPDVEAALATLSFSGNVLTIQVKVVLKTTGEGFEIGLTQGDAGLVVL